MFFTSSCVDMFLSMFLQWGVLSLSLYIYILMWDHHRGLWSVLGEAGLLTLLAKTRIAAKMQASTKKQKSDLLKPNMLFTSSFADLSLSMILHLLLSLFLSLSMSICIYIIYILFNCCAAIHNQFLNMHRDICNHCPPGMSDSSRSEIGVCSEHGSLSGSSDND